MIDLSDKDFFSTKDNFEILGDVESKLIYGIRKKYPSVSIMIPTYLRNSYLPETIDSALRQETDIEYEIVVVDNNADYEDYETLKIINKYDEEKVSYYKNSKNLGMFGNWNRCLELAHAKWVLILHDDDTISPKYINEMMNIVRSYPDISGVGCGYTLIDECSNPIILSKSSFMRKFAEMYLIRNSYSLYIQDFYYFNPISIMGFLINRDKAFEIGGFDNIWDPVSDYVFIANLANISKIRRTDAKLLNYRKAVNASLTVKHLIGMVEGDAYLKQDINSHYNFMNIKKSIYYRSALILNHEKSLVENWFLNLDSNQEKIVLEEYDRFNKSMGIKKISKNERKIIKNKQRLYSCWIRFFRR